MRSPRSSRQRLEHIRDCVGRLRHMTDSLTFAEYEQHIAIPLACQRLLEIIGEAANYLPHEILDQAPNIPWRRIIGLRHRLAHEYDNIDDEAIWLIIRQQLPQLETEVNRLLASAAL